ncbi:MAG: radical SAM protein [Candidatus Schekmanbacteria bacterium]|nr:MAG: radical SAM protein [Candidatus Schekmanbacteria bacterium]
MKVLLLNPPARKREYENIVVPPLGLAYLSSSAKAKGFDIEILDAFALGINWDKLREEVRKIKPDILAIGGMSPVIDTSFRAAKLLRNDVNMIVMGGPHITAFGERVFEDCPEIDIGVAGEGEITFCELLDYIERGKDYSSVKGLILREGKTQSRELIADVDSIPFPDRTSLPNERYRYPFAWEGPVTTMFTSRGCPYRCVFCDKSVFGSQWRGRSAENIISEIEMIVSEYGTKNFIFYDDLFTLKRDRVLEICSKIEERKIDIKWKCEGRVDRIDKEMLKAMKSAGCRVIAFGVESGNQKGIDYLKKNLDLSKVKNAFQMARDEGIETIAYFILGIPNETYEDEKRTVEFAVEINPTYAQFSTLSPYYGTWIYDEAVKRGWYKETSAKNPLDKDLKRPVIISDNWSEEKLQKIIRYAYRKFFLRPSYLLDRVRAVIKSPTRIKNLFKSGWSVVKWLLSKG